VSNPVSRRSFLRVVTVGTTSVLVASTLPGRASAAVTSRARPAAESPDGVVRLGRSYLRTHPEENKLGTLRSSLPQLDATQPYRPQLPTLAAANTDDFANGRVVSVDGWLLGDTEARAAAAISLGA
jgi:hypothetical protein